MAWETCRRNSSIVLYQTFWNFAAVLSWSEDVHVLLGLSSHHLFLSTFSLFIDVFQVPVSISLGTSWVQLILEFPTHHFQTMRHTCSTWSEDVRVVLGLSSYHTDLKVVTLYWQSHDVGGRLPATGFYLMLNHIYSQTSVVRMSLGPWKFFFFFFFSFFFFFFLTLVVLVTEGYHSASQEANGDNLGMPFPMRQF